MKIDILDLLNEYSAYSVKKLNACNINEIYDLENTQPFFFENLSEKLTKQSVKEVLKEVPINKSLKDKYFLGFYDKNGHLVAILDLIVNYPDFSTVFIGLFMLDAKICGRGVGSSIFYEIEKAFKKLKFKKIRLGYVDKNKQSERFWLKKCGFVNTGEIKKYEKYTIAICEKIL